MTTAAAAMLLLVLAEPAPAGEMASRPRVAAGMHAVATPPVNAAAQSLPISAPHERGSLRVGLTPQNARPGLAAQSPLPSIATMMAALALVLGLFLATVWLLRRGMPAGPRLLPSEVLEVLGRAPLAGRQQAQLVRCGNKLLLLSVGSAGVETLTEITDPAEVDRVAGLCQQLHPHSASTAFRQVFQQFGQKPARGFLGRRGNDLQLANDGFDGGTNETEADRG